MKKLSKYIILSEFLVLNLVFCCSCGEKNLSSHTTKNKVKQVMEQQMEKADNQKPNSNTQKPVITEDDVNNAVAEAIKENSEIPSEELSQNEDKNKYDLTAMNSDMIYATVFQMMTDPYSYQGKKIRMEGNYNYILAENSKKYHYCVIQDATACCAQGMEFVCKKGKFKKCREGQSIIVEGTFETYKEDGDDNLYCRLKNATVIIK